MAHDLEDPEEELAWDAEGTMWVLALAISLNGDGVCSRVEYDRLKAKHVSLGLKYDMLDQTFEDYKGKYEVHVGLVKEMIEKNKEIEYLKKERDERDVRIKELEAELETNTRSAEEETEDEKSLKTRVDLVGKIRELE